ncbi:MAG TPA: adenylate/guanylate cyclase domain-containing protein [Holophagaceae bacterium]|nr:adenylate/guanylate cyclase domain-containing protein [Holophagaceae bacterium]
MTSHPSDPDAHLWHLVARRCEPGADRAAIDAEIWATFGTDSAVMFTDLSGFSRRVAEFGILHFLQVIHEQKALLLPIVAAHDGVHLKTEADSFLLRFPDPAQALRCAVAMQAACEAHNVDRKPEDQVLLCVGLGWGRILQIGMTDVWGQEVNAASKLGEDTAQAREILVTDAFKRQVEGRGAWRFTAIEAVSGSDVNWRVAERVE